MYCPCSSNEQRRAEATADHRRQGAKTLFVCEHIHQKERERCSLRITFLCAEPRGYKHRAEPLFVRVYMHGRDAPFN